MQPMESVWLVVVDGPRDADPGPWTLDPGRAPEARTHA